MSDIRNDKKRARVATKKSPLSRVKRTSTKGSIAAPAVCALSLLTGAAYAETALPSGGNVVAGSGSISSNGSVMTITQTTAKMAIDWQSFNIGKANAVNFVQPSGSAVALNRVLGTDVSVIQGALNANGQLFLVNPNGVLFTPTAQVNVGGIVASTLNLKTDDFMAGKYAFAGSSSNAIINQGNISAEASGTVALIAARIINTGSIAAQKGNVLMGAGSEVTLDMGGPVKLRVTQGAINALIEQGGAIKADGGLVYLTAKSASQLAATVINHTGITEAQTLATGEKGQIILLGDKESDRILVGGKLDASAPKGGDGGFIETSAAKVSIANDANITTIAAHGTTGQWLIDPTDFTVAATGGDITGSALGSLLASNSVTIETATGTNSATNLFGTSGTNGDIFVNQGVTWSSGNTLTLKAHRNIEINATLDASGGSGGKLALQYGQGAVANPFTNKATYLINAPLLLQDSGNANGINGTTPTNFSTKFGSGSSTINFTVITSPSGLASLNSTLENNPTGTFALGADLTLAAPTGGATSNWTPVTSGPNTFNNFSGRLDGLGHTISGLTLNPAVTYTRDVGLFARTNLAMLSNLNLTGVSITYSGAAIGATRVATLVGQAVDTSITNVSVSGTINETTGAGFIGGLVGRNIGTTINYANSAVAITTSTNFVYAGGLVGEMDADSPFNSSVSNSSASGAISSSGNFVVLGGLVGGVYGTSTIRNSISNSSASGAVTASGNSVYAGGLVGDFESSTLSNSSASGAVQATNAINSYVGGLVGLAYESTFQNTYATGAVTGTGAAPTGADVMGNVGGLVGKVYDSASSIADSYARGAVTGQTGTVVKGGLVGYLEASATITNSFWDTTTSTQSGGIGVGSSAGLTGKSTADMQTLATFTGAGWTFTSASSNGAYPVLTMTGSTPFWSMNETTSNSGGGGSSGGGSSGGGSSGGGSSGGGSSGGGSSGGSSSGGSSSTSSAAIENTATSTAQALGANTGNSPLNSSAYPNNATPTGGITSQLAMNTSAGSTEVRQSGGLVLLGTPTGQSSSNTATSTTNATSQGDDGGGEATDSKTAENKSSDNKKRSQSASSAQGNNAGRDASGFMRVFVVKGGVNTDFGLIGAK